MRANIRSILLNAAPALFTVAIFLTAARSAAAEPNFLATWQGRYPGSSSDDNVSLGTGQSCALCHFNLNGGSNWNAYGWRIRQGIQGGQSTLAAIIAAETVNSDADPTGSTNLVEINASTQPGWTPGPNNTKYLPSSSQSGLTPPAGILGSLDPGAGGIAGFCFGDGSGTACPCSNNSPVGANAGCLNSLGTGGALAGTGTASIAADTLVLQGSSMPNSSALYFQGTAPAATGAGTVFGDGLRCAAGAVIRLGTKTNAGGASQYPDVGDQPVSVRGLNVAGGQRYYQSWYRNAAAFCTASAFNVTNGVSVLWGP